jgi:hypothetical protein
VVSDTDVITEHVKKLKTKYYLVMSFGILAMLMGILSLFKVIDLSGKILYIAMGLLGLASFVLTITGGKNLTSYPSIIVLGSSASLLGMSAYFVYKCKKGEDDGESGQEEISPPKKSAEKSEKGEERSSSPSKKFHYETPEKRLRELRQQLVENSQQYQKDRRRRILEQALIAERRKSKGHSASSHHHRSRLEDAPRAPSHNPELDDLSPMKADDLIKLTKSGGSHKSSSSSYNPDLDDYLLGDESDGKKSGGSHKSSSSSYNPDLDDLSPMKADDLIKLTKSGRSQKSSPSSYNSDLDDYLLGDDLSPLKPEELRRYRMSLKQSKHEKDDLSETLRSIRSREKQSGGDREELTIEEKAELYDALSERE